MLDETKKLIKELTIKRANFCNKKDYPLVTFLSVWLNEGLKEAKKQPYEKSWIDNLRSGNMVGSKNRLYFNPEEGSIGFALLMAGANGYIERSKN